MIIRFTIVRPRNQQTVGSIPTAGSTGSTPGNAAPSATLEPRLLAPIQHQRGHVRRNVNDDGISDIIVGAHAFDNPETNEGRVVVFHGGP